MLTPTSQAGRLVDGHRSTESTESGGGDGATGAVVRIDNVSRSYGTRLAIDDISLEIDAGITGILGPNGAGKSTLLSCLAGIAPWNRGVIEISGVDLARQPRRARRHVGYMPERVAFPAEMTVEAYLGFVAAMKGISRAERAPAIDLVCQRVGLTDVRERVVGNLSKGYRQRLGLAQALLNDPTVVILDEPTAGLDPMNVLEVRDLLQTDGKERAIILATHHLPEARLMCDRVVVLAEGTIVYDATASNINTPVESGQLVRLVLRGAHEDPSGLVDGDEHLRGLEVVSVQQVDHDWIIVVAPHDSSMLGALVRRLSKHLEVVRVESTSDPLEDAFRQAVLSAGGQSTGGQA